MTTKTIQLTRLHPKQATIARNNARFKVVVCGRRWGKTTLAINTLAERVIHGERVAYLAPSYKMLADVWRKLYTALKPIVTYKNESLHRLETVTKGAVDCWSLDAPDSIRGRSYHLIVIDECALVPNLFQVWNEALSPLLTDVRGKAIFLSTPRGFNGLHTLYTYGLQSSDGWASWQLPTSSNPYIPVDEIERQRAILPERSFAQEYLAQFVADSGTVFRGLQNICTAQPAKPQKGRQYIFGVDWGRDNDFTAVSVVDVASKTQVFLDRFNQVGWNVQRDRLRALYELWKPTVIIAEANSIGAVNIDALIDELPIQPFTTTQSTKNQIIDSLVLAIERQEILLLADSVLYNELSAYEMERGANGIYRYSAPSGGHDDTVIATALSWYGCQQENPFNANQWITF